METTTTNHGQTWPSPTEATAATRESLNARHAIGSVLLVLGLLVSSGAEECLTGAFLTLVLVIAASALLNASEGKGDNFKW